MTRQPWWPKNLEVDENSNPTTFWMAQILEQVYEAMDAAWRERIVKTLKSHTPNSKNQAEVLDWFVVQLLKEEGDG